MSWDFLRIWPPPHPLFGTQAGLPPTLTRDGTNPERWVRLRSVVKVIFPDQKRQLKKCSSKPAQTNSRNAFVQIVKLIEAIILASISERTLVRARLVEYQWRYIRLASRYEDHGFGGPYEAGGTSRVE